MTVVLSMNSVEMLMKYNNIAINNTDSYNDKIMKLKNAKLLENNEQYVPEVNVFSNSSLKTINTQSNSGCSPCGEKVIPLSKEGAVLDITDLDFSMDQLISGDVNITYNDCGIYTITFLTNNPFTMYQVWSSKDNIMNKTRLVTQVTAETWVDKFNKVRSVRFTPTTIIDDRTNRYICVIQKAYIKNNKLVFEVSTYDINFQGCISTNLTNKLPLGKVLNVRFDIDNSSLTGFTGLGPFLVGPQQPCSNTGFFSFNSNQGSVCFSGAMM